MSRNRFVWDGLAELKAALRSLPSELATDALEIVNRHGLRAADRVRANYEAHRHTGNLAEHVKVQTVSAGRFGAAVVVKSTAKHAFLFEYGTAGKHRYTTKGAHRGVMPPAPPTHAFVPVMQQERRLMYGDFAALLERAGFVVVGHAA